ncbi:hypothetical protein ACFFIX_13505 [Metabacillus herbersteinensis]|uniref:Sporulation protein n=1 Tax=Metabacillus herbersteinensis TaxID=283816 RepID=A0ABV6GFJ6_9BACI
MKKFFFIVVLMMLLPACAGNQNVAHPYDREDSNGTKLMTNREGNGIYNRELDDDRTNTNQNPNFIDLSESRPNYGTDENKLSEALIGEEGLTMGPVVRNGQDIRVTVYTSDDLSKKELRDREEELHNKMVRALPRYHIKINLEKR